MGGHGCCAALIPEREKLGGELSEPAGAQGRILGAAARRQPADRAAWTLSRNRNPPPVAERWRKSMIRIAAIALVACAATALTSITTAAERAIDRQIEVAASLEDAWDAWTTRAGIVSFFAPEAAIEPRVGGALQLRFDPTAPSGLRGADDTRFMALQPKTMLSFDWNAPPHLPQARAQRTFVIVRFEPLGQWKTRVSLHPTGWGEGGEWDQAFADFDRARGFVLANLKKRFDSDPMDWSEWMRQLRQARERAAQKK
jgi:uncharacterized protein YndB with AHSA1/START domain